MIRKIVSGLILMAVVGMSWGSAQAYLAYTNRTDFTAQGSIAENFGFTGIGTGDMVSPFSPTPGVTYTNDVNTVLDSNSGFNNALNVFVNGILNPDLLIPGPITAQVNGTYNMLGFELGSLLNADSSITLNLTTSLTTLSFSLPVTDVGAGMKFYGFVTEGFEGYITGFSLVGNAPAITNVTLGTATAVPEPSTYLLLCLSLGVVGYARKKMTRHSVVG
jgi:PEP-CTERM motif